MNINILPPEVLVIILQYAVAGEERVNYRVMKVCKLWEHLLLNYVYVHLYTNILPPKELFHVSLASFCESLSEFRWLPEARLHDIIRSIRCRLHPGVIGFYLTHSPFFVRNGCIQSYYNSVVAGIHWRYHNEPNQYLILFLVAYFNMVKSATNAKFLYYINMSQFSKVSAERAVESQGDSPQPLTVCAMVTQRLRTNMRLGAKYYTEMARACTAVEFIIRGLFDRLLQETLENINYDYGDDDSTAAVIRRDILQTEFNKLKRRVDRNAYNSSDSDGYDSDDSSVSDHLLFDVY